MAGLFPVSCEFQFNDKYTRENYHGVWQYMDDCLLVLAAFLLWGFVKLWEACSHWFTERRRLRERLKWLYEVEPTYRTYDGYPPDWSFRREEVMRRAGFKCEVCFTPVVLRHRRNSAGAIAHTHHIIPLSRGGTHDLDNLQCLCVSCHQAQHPDNPNVGRKTYRRNSRRSRWS